MVSPRYSCASRPTADGLDPQREVLADQGDLRALVGEVAGHREDPGVVVAEPEAGGQRVGVGVVELDPDRAALLTDRHRLVEPTVGDPQLVEHPQRRAREVAELGVVPLALQLGDHHDGQHHLVLLEAPQRPGIGQQDAGVEHVGTDELFGGRLRRAGLGRHGHSSQTGTRTRRPVLNSPAAGPGGRPKAGVPASTHDPQRTAGQVWIVLAQDSGLPIRRASPPADAANVRRGEGRAGATRPTTR